jgi:hypothetical protein
MVKDVLGDIATNTPLHFVESRRKAGCKDLWVPFSLLDYEISNHYGGFKRGIRHIMEYSHHCHEDDDHCNYIKACHEKTSVIIRSTS